ncbi:MAG: methionine--tRNA ligase subunit beta, partial [Syntrophales bacterium LBB04]|nr:methionine--tRNA ligase subunit beta [Syntrophales bacterium LBB04]
WVQVKDPGQRPKLDQVMYNLLEALRVISVLILPFMPNTAGKIMEQIGIEDRGSQDFRTISAWGGLPSGKTLTPGEGLFPRVAPKPEEGASAKQDGGTPFKKIIDYEDWEKIDLRAAKILAAEAVPRSEKLVKLKIDLGEERTIVAGIGKDFKPEDLVGKTVVVVANLKPAKLMGIESQGMLLAAGGAAGLALLTFDGNPEAGAKIR